MGIKSGLPRSIWYPNTCPDQPDHTLLQGTSPAERPLLQTVGHFSFRQLYLGSFSSCWRLQWVELHYNWSPYGGDRSIQNRQFCNGSVTGSSLNLPGTTVALIKTGARCAALLALHCACGVCVDESKWLYQVHNLW